jgi:hypothetical protein
LTSSKRICVPKLSDILSSLIKGIRQHSKGGELERHSILSETFRPFKRPFYSQRKSKIRVSDHNSS